ncbi:MAG TPA: c-type cytochrome [Acidimicrobiales bacterium]|nr:c-type cytochrome [Acidimicrobiales bacterium]
MTMVLAASTAQRLGTATVVILLLGVAAYGLFHLFRTEAVPPGSEVELAPNRKPYLDDEGLEGPKLNRAQLSALLMLVVVAVGLPAYWLREPSRQEGATRGFDERAAERGFILFQPNDSPVPAGNVGKFGCGGCHGVTGQGGQTSYSLPDPIDPSKPPRQVKWIAPPLNDVLLRYSEAEVTSVIVYGRVKTPMPPWGVKGGGPMNDQQVSDLVAYIKSIQRDPAEVKKENLEKYGTDGATIFDQFCSRCHTQGWSYGETGEVGGGAFGPSLLDGATVRQFPLVEGDDSHAEFVSKGGEYAKAYGVRGVGGDEAGGMPGFGEMLTPEQIKAVVEYERGL